MLVPCLLPLQRSIMALLAQATLTTLRQMPLNLWSKSIEKKNRTIYIFDIIGSLKFYNEARVRAIINLSKAFFIKNKKAFLALKEPNKDLLLIYIYRKQQQILRAIADEIKEIQEANEVSNINCHKIFLITLNF